MLIFHEGLPRSGKSYSACVDHIIPALQSGRHVFACVAGLNHQQFAQVCDLPLDVVHELLHQLVPADLEPAKIQALHERFSTGEVVKGDYGEDRAVSLLQNSLLIIDEIQNLYPAGNEKLPDGARKFIAEHGHDGIDVVLMSQSFKSVHKDWRVRVQRKLIFTKLTAIGRDNAFKWEAQEALGPDKFQKINSGTKKYDPKFFGLYKSHTEGTTNKGNLQDDRVNIFKTTGFRLGLPVFVIVLVFAGLFLRSFFTDPSKFAKVPQSSPVPSRPSPAPAVERQTAVVAAPSPTPRPHLDSFDTLASANRVRLVGLWTNDTGMHALLEIVDGSYHVVQRFKTTQLAAMGWHIEWAIDQVTLRKGEAEHVAMEFPVDPWGKTPQSAAAQAKLKP